MSGQHSQTIQSKEVEIEETHGQDSPRRSERVPQISVKRNQSMTKVGKSDTGSSRRAVSDYHRGQYKESTGSLKDKR